jgi:hypothetical protein
MSKQITATELAAIVTKLLTGESGEVDGFESFQSFMTDIARVVCDHCGGEVRTDAAPFESAWIVVVHGDDRLPDAFGGIWREDDPKGTLFEQDSAIAPGPGTIPTGVSTSSTFATDGYRDARGGLPASPPTHPATTVLAGEYLLGYREGKLEIGQAAFESSDDPILPEVSAPNTLWAKEQGPMNDGQYIAFKGVRCPSCGSSNVNGSQLEVDAGLAFQPMHCSECEANWSDSYGLTGYTDLEGGIDFEGVESAVEDVRSRREKYGFSVDSEAQAREVVSESRDILGIDLSELELKIAVSKLMS